MDGKLGSKGRNFLLGHRLAKAHWGHYIGPNKLPEYPNVERETESQIKLPYQFDKVRLLKRDLHASLQEAAERGIDTHTDGPANDLHSQRDFEWRMGRIVSASKAISTASAIQIFHDDFLAKEKAAKLNARQARKDYYALKAGQLDPPLEAGALKYVPAIQNAMSRDHTKPWFYLVSDVIAQRKHAERRYLMRDGALDISTLSWYDQFCKDWWSQTGRERVFERVGRDTLQDMLRRLNAHGRDVFDRPSFNCLFTITSLYIFWRKYYSLPHASKPRAISLHNHFFQDGTYALLLSDIKTVHGLLSKLLKEESGEYSFLDNVKFRCPGCIKKGKDIPTWDIEKILMHIYKCHASQPGNDFSHWVDIELDGKRYREYPMWAMRWPRELPLLIPGEESTGTWPIRSIRWMRREGGYYSLKKPACDQAFLFFITGIHTRAQSQEMWRMTGMSDWYV